MKPGCGAVNGKNEHVLILGFALHAKRVYGGALQEGETKKQALYEQDLLGWVRLRALQRWLPWGLWASRQRRT